MNESHIKLAIQIYNQAEGLFVPAEIATLDMAAGNENEPESVKMYDQFFGTNYFPEYEKVREENTPFHKSNKFMTGTRDFGDKSETIDGKSSTDKNVFDAKRFLPIDTDHVIQVNGYGILYDTSNLKLYNNLMPATFGQRKKFVDAKSYIDMLSEAEQDRYEAVIDQNYDYSFLPIAKRISVREIPLIDNFEKIVETRIEVLNEWIVKNLKQ